MITLQEAAQKAGVSDKTLRRAINAGSLTDYRRPISGMRNNQPILIDEQDLDAYIASRQSEGVHHASSGLEMLQSRIEELESLVENATLVRKTRADALDQRITELQELYLKMQSELLRQQQENIALARRVQALEIAIDAQEDKQQGLVPTLTEEKKALVNLAFDDLMMSDFSKLWHVFGSD